MILPSFYPRGSRQRRDFRFHGEPISSPTGYPMERYASISTSGRCTQMKPISARSRARILHGISSGNVWPGGIATIFPGRSAPGSWNFFPGFLMPNHTLIVPESPTPYLIRSCLACLNSLLSGPAKIRR